MNNFASSFLPAFRRVDVTIRRAVIIPLARSSSFDCRSFLGIAVHRRWVVHIYSRCLTYKHYVNICSIFVRPTWAFGVAYARVRAHTLKPCVRRKERRNPLCVAARRTSTLKMSTSVAFFQPWQWKNIIP